MFGSSKLRVPNWVKGLMSGYYRCVNRSHLNSTRLFLCSLAFNIDSAQPQQSKDFIVSVLSFKISEQNSHHIQGEQGTFILSCHKQQKTSKKNMNQALRGKYLNLKPKKKIKILLLQMGYIQQFTDLITSVLLFKASHNVPLQAVNS